MFRHDELSDFPWQNMVHLTATERQLQRLVSLFPTHLQTVTIDCGRSLRHLEGTIEPHLSSHPFSNGSSESSWAWRRLHALRIRNALVLTSRSHGRRRWCPRPFWHSWLVNGQSVGQDRPGLFCTIGGDMKVDQTINLSQKVLVGIRLLALLGTQMLSLCFNSSTMKLVQ